MGRRELNQADVARRLGENEMWVYRRIRGKQQITLADMHRIAKALDIGVHELLPSPEIAAGAADPGLTARYIAMTVQSPIMDRPKDNRPAGRPLAGAGVGIGRTGYLDRGGRRGRDR